MNHLEPAWGDVQVTAIDLTAYKIYLYISFRIGVSYIPVLETWTEQGWNCFYVYRLVLIMNWNWCFIFYSFYTIPHHHRVHPWPYTVVNEIKMRFELNSWTMFLIHTAWVTRMLMIGIHSYSQMLYAESKWKCGVGL